MQVSNSMAEVEIIDATGSSLKGRLVAAVALA